MVALGLTLLYSYVRFIEVKIEPPMQVLSPKLIKEIDTLILNQPIIVGIQIAAVDLQKNERYTIYARMTNPQLEELFVNFRNRKVLKSVPVFMLDDNQNLRIVKLINHEFVCSPYIGTISHKFVPESAKYITTVCAIAIPPSYGKFKGMIGVSLSREPTDLERDQIRGLSKEISAKVFEEID
jgi:hypothetical protein